MKTNTKNILLRQFFIHITLATFGFLVFMPTYIHGATGNTGCAPNTICNPLSTGDSLISLITAILNNIIMPIAAVGAVVWIIYAGFLYLKAEGNPKAIGEAHSTLLWALIGTGILLGAAGISKVIENTVNSIVK